MAERPEACRPSDGLRVDATGRWAEAKDVPRLGEEAVLAAEKPEGCRGRPRERLCDVDVAMVPVVTLGVVFV